MMSRVFLCLFSLFLIISTIDAQLEFRSWHFDSQSSFFLEDCIDAVVGPDGDFLYVLGRGDDAISVLERNDQVWDFKFAYLSHSEDAFRMRSPQQIIRKEVSDLIFVSSFNAISVFRVNTDGSLKSHQQINNQELSAPITSLNSTFRMALSPDKNFLYTVNFWNSSIGIFSIDEDGYLNLESQIINGLNMEGMEQPHSLSISPDGQYAFVSSYKDYQISIFRRNPVNGNLTFLANDKAPFSGEYQALNIAISPDNKFVYVKYANGIYVYQLDRNMGELTSVEFIEGKTLPRYSNNNQMIISKDGNFIYDLNTGDGTFVIYQRNPITGVLNELSKTESGELFNELETVRNISYDSEMEEVYLHSSFGKNSYVQIAKRDLASGLLSVKEAIQNPDEFIHTLDKLVQGVISPDQKYVYAASQQDQAINLFKIKDNGHLEFITYEKGLLSGKTLDNLQSISLSPSGNNLYAVAEGESVLMQFRIDPNNGLLEFQKNYTEEDDPKFHGIKGAFKTVISDDGRYLYLSSPLRNGILIFERNVDNGNLTFLDAHYDSEDQIDALGGVREIAISKDGDFFYALAPDENAITLFERYPGTGLIYQKEVLTSEHTNSNLDYPIQLDQSPDGNQIYVTSFHSNSLSIFDLDKNYGNLYYRKSFRNEEDPNVLLKKPSAVTVAHDGSYVLVGAGGNEALSVFKRKSDGDLIWRESIQDGKNSNQGISFTSDILILPNSKYFYTLDQDNDAIAFYENSFVTNQEEVLQDQIVTYPNPFEHSITIEFKNTASKYYIELFDIYGRLILDLNINTPTQTLNLNDLSNGAYLCRISSEHHAIQQWIIKSN